MASILASELSSFLLPSQINRVNPVEKMKYSYLVHHFLEHSAERFPDKIALIHEDVRATYAQINARANQLTRLLLDRGIRHGDRVVVLLENCLEYVVSYYGVLKAGAVAVPLSTDLKPDSLARLLGEIEPKAIISSSRFERLLQATDLSPFRINAVILKGPNLTWSSAPFPLVPWEDVIRDEKSPNIDLPIQESALAGIIYTSGSTGKPKGAMLSHRNIVSNTHSICQYLHLNEKDIQMAVLPFYYVMGKSLLNTHVAAGGTVVINNKFAFPASVIKQMVEEHVTGFSGVPSTYAYLLHRSPLAKYRDRLHSLRYCAQAGGHMSRAIKEQLRRVIPPHTKIYIMYGATEASARLSYLEPDKFEEKMDSIGKAIPGVTLTVRNQAGKELPPREVGELVASGPNIMMGYWKDEAATDAVISENGYHTGDESYQDEHGYFYIVGRKDDLLKVGGHRINPVEIEDTIMDSGRVIEVVVFGLPDHLLGNKLVAVMTPISNPPAPNEILLHCAKKLPKYKVPSEIKFVARLPKSSSGKIDKKQLKYLIAHS